MVQSKFDVSQRRKQMHDNIIDYFKTMKSFESEEDIPDIPQIGIISQEEFDNIIIPNLIRCGAIPKDKLEVGRKYLGTCRNASEAFWDGTNFIYLRHKFGCYYHETINHFQDDDGYDLFIPIKQI